MLIGSRMARDTGLKVGDLATVRWRDARGTFDAQEVRIAQVMTTTVQTVDSGQLWLPLDRLRRMARMEGEATWIVLGTDTSAPGTIAGWEFKDTDFLLSDLRAMVRAKRIGGSVAYLMLLFLAMLAILDTQILSIFHRRKEIGTLMALGVTRGAVIRMFTMEGAFNAVLAALAGAVYGIPLLAYAARIGLPLPAAMDQAGISLGERIYPAYGAALVVGTTALVLVVTTIVSYLPTRRIARLKPTDALRGQAHMIPFLIKGLWRDRTRSLFPFITVVTGVMITVLMQTYMAGITSNMSWSSASLRHRALEGHVESVRQGG